MRMRSHSSSRSLAALPGWILLLAVVMFRAPAGAQTYRIEDLGTLGGGFSQAFGINDDGVVIGVAATADTQARAFRWLPASSHGRRGMQDLGALGGISSIAYGINAVGQIVGAAD